MFQYQVHRCHLPPRLESAGRCSAPWLGPEHSVARAGKLRGTEPGKQKLAERPASSCKAPRGGNTCAVPLKEDSKVQVVVACFLATAVKNPLKTAGERSPLVIPPDVTHFASWWSSPAVGKLVPGGLAGRLGVENFLGPASVGITQDTHWPSGG